MLTAVISTYFASCMETTKHQDFMVGRSVLIIEFPALPRHGSKKNEGYRSTSAARFAITAISPGSCFISVQPHTHPPSILPSSSHHPPSILPASSHHFPSILPASSQHPSIILPSYFHHSPIILTSLSHHPSILDFGNGG